MWMSITGMYEYDHNLFNGLQVPEGVNKEAVINNICLQCAELELLYADINTMKLAITTWSVAHLLSWEKLYNTMIVEYNPIWNVDANETETGKRGIIRNMNGTNTEDVDLTTTEAVQGFNSDTWSNARKTTQDGTNEYTIENEENVQDDNTITRRRTGNIGVTATQDLIQKEREIAEFSIIEYITQSFKERFCLLIY